MQTATLDQIFSSTSGNPFLVSEIAREIGQRSAGDANDEMADIGEISDYSLPMPERIRDAIDGSLDRLSERCIQLLSAASALGHTFSVGELSCNAWVGAKQ